MLAVGGHLADGDHAALQALEEEAAPLAAAEDHAGRIDRDGRAEVQAPLLADDAGDAQAVALTVIDTFDLERSFLWAAGRGVAGRQESGGETEQQTGQRAFDHGG